MGFSPFIWSFKNEISSDLPFLFFAAAALYLMDGPPAGRTPPNPNPLLHGERTKAARSAAGRSQIRFGVLAGLFMVLACGTRTVGVVLPAALVCHEFLLRKRPGLSVFTVSALLVVAAAAVLRFVLLPGTGYLDQMRLLTPARVTGNAWHYAKSLAYFWSNGYAKPAAAILAAVFTLLAVTGYLRRVRAGTTILEVFLPLYLAVVLIWPPEQGMRFLIPALPLYLLCGFSGLDALAAAFPKLPARKAAIGLLVAIALSFGAHYSTLNFGPTETGPDRPASRALFDYVRRATGEEDVIAFAKPRVLALYTGRRAVALHETADVDALWAYAREVGVTRVVAGPIDGEPERALIEAGRFPLQRVYTNADFEVYAVEERRKRGD
jgi:hypothetical protein